MQTFTLLNLIIAIAANLVLIVMFAIEFEKFLRTNYNYYYTVSQEKPSQEENFVVKAN